MLQVAWKNLRQDLTRMGLSMGGVAAAVLLILALQGVFAGSAKQIALYIDESRADVLVAQAGVRNMHMANSLLSPAVLEKTEQVPGVKEAVPIAYFTGKMNIGDDEVIGYIVGVDGARGIGGPWRMAEGSPTPGSGEIVVARNVAAPRGLGLGDRMQVMDRWFTISGLSLETDIISSSFVFISPEDARALRPQQGAINYVLVTADNPKDGAALARRIEEQVAEVSALSRAAFAESDRQIAIQMGLNVIQAMSVAALVIGLMVIMLTLYTATLEKSREYGILKAIGANNRSLFGVILFQAAISTIAGFAAGTIMAWIVSRLVGTYAPGVSIVLEFTSLWRVFLSVLGIGAIASLLPAWRIARVDPLVAFRS